MSEVVVSPSIPWVKSRWVRASFAGLSSQGSPSATAQKDSPRNLSVGVTEKTPSLGDEKLLGPGCSKPSASA